MCDEVSIPVLWEVVVRADTVSELESYHMRVMFHPESVDRVDLLRAKYVVDERNGVGYFFNQVDHMREANVKSSVRVDSCVRL